MSQIPAPATVVFQTLRGDTFDVTVDTATADHASAARLAYDRAIELVYADSKRTGLPMRPQQYAYGMSFKSGRTIHRYSFRVITD